VGSGYVSEKFVRVLSEVFACQKRGSKYYRPTVNKLPGFPVGQKC
jgi:hypothetical protein